jgi:phosphoglycerol transferase MdoB-like AlkP superfamily enzyme
MSDQSVGMFGTRLPREALRAVAAALTARLPVPAAEASLSAWSAAAVWAGVLAYYYFYEGETANVAFVAGCTLALGATLTIVTRRALFSAVVVAASVATIVWAASVKRQTMNMVVHAYDLFFYLTSWSTFTFLWTDHRRLVVTLVACIAAIIALAVVAWRRDSTRVGRSHALVGFAVAALLANTGAAYKGERRHMQFNFEALYVSSFFASWGETVETLWRGSMLEAASRGLRREPPLKALASCSPSVKPPHIVLIHQESLVPPALFAGLDYDRSVDPLFRSQDGQVHKLRVETYGGASWLTEFSILAGLSTQAFGGMRQFVQTFLVNKLTDTLPQNLARCGYRNVLFYPMLKNFVSNDKFYSSIGLKEVFDLKAQGAKTANERDRFYYGNALAEMERHVAVSSKPLFTYIQTMSAHWPYDITFEPGENVAGGGPGTHPEMHEYLRRVSLAKRDYDYLIAEMKRRFPGERILVVQYGDHQPTATRMLLGFKEDTEAEDASMDREALGYMTYYAVDGINYDVPPLPPHEVVDVPYLGLVVQQAAGLPLSDAWRERARLMALCHGRNYGCAPQQEVLAFHRRLIDSGLILAR